VEAALGRGEGGRRDGAAVDAAQEAHPLERAEVTADGLRRHRELLGELGHRHAPPVDDQPGDGLLPLLRVHGASSRVLGGSMLCGSQGSTVTLIAVPLRTRSNASSTSSSGMRWVMRSETGTCPEAMYSSA